MIPYGISDIDYDRIVVQEVLPRVEGNQQWVPIFVVKAADMQRHDFGTNVFADPVIFCMTCVSMSCCGALMVMRSM